MAKKHIFLVLSLNFLIATSFFVKNIGVGYSQLSSDMQNIVPMCMKLDNPELYPNDLFLTDTTNFKFYTPFFIETLRVFAGFTDGNYVQVSNILLFISSLMFGICWFFLLFKLFRNKFWIALLISILMRGIVWLPAGEIWGISDLWTIMPRTLYIALMPIPFLVLFQRKNLHFYAASILIGLIFNFHPISGLGGILIFFMVVCCGCYFKYAKCSFKQISLGVLLVITGMLPFVVTYFGKTDTAVFYDLQAYGAAFDAKIASHYQEVYLVFKSWLKTKFLFFLVPLVVFIFYGFSKSNTYGKEAAILLVLTGAIFFLPVLSIYVEQALNKGLGINLRMSFQLVRIQKMVVLPAYLAMGYLLVLLVDKHIIDEQLISYGFASYLLILTISHSPFFNKVPLIGDDISRSIVPNFSEVFKPLSERKTDFDKMANYIKENTPVAAVFYKNYYLRTAAQRSVRFDSKGANILVEGNPQKLIEWHRDRFYLKAASEAERLRYLKERGVDYMLLNEETDALRLEKKIGNQFLYTLQ
ncbi:hypothetical protein MB09_08925 [Aequorivita vladivostokensis]|uniref:Glycosyltransferase RgtA/B/C/D-like domain-containing protein n=2 Tax=Aequorivita vladivostokensis TaxID=171194 RepID=A0ABR5DHE3_9FLAO|nr:hypothetical protein MB09_08925 [Aequorivita vladivostokensis]